MLLDVRLQRIDVGDTVAYPQRSGSSMWLVVGRVISVEEFEPASKGGRVGVKRDYHRESFTTKIDRMVVVEKGGAVDQDENE